MISTWQLALCAALASLTMAAPIVVITNGTVIGSTNGGADSFMGIPYAIPPTSTSRLTNPTALNSRFSGNTFTATGNPTACPGYIKATPTGLAALVESALANSPLIQAATNTGEDCLNLNVQRTSGLTTTSKAPVLVYIYGGGFESGSTSQYDGTSIIQKASSLGTNLVYVAMSYRLAGLGFLPGKEMAGVANLGLKDQRLALQWIHDNIAQFGGDPTKVTIWGESAGSVSVFNHLVINGGDNDYKGIPLFVGAIMNSGSIFPALNISSPTAQSVYNTLVTNAGCNGASNTLSCLRGLSSGSFISAMETLPAIFDYQSLHLAYFPRPDPSDNFYPTSPEISAYGGKYAKVPLIIGDMEDEATFFSLVQSNITNTGELNTYLESYFPEAVTADVTSLTSNYPDDPAQGSPFETGSDNNLYTEYKRLAAILADFFFTLTRRAYLGFVANNGGVKTWTYLNTYLHGFILLGSFHGADILNDRVSPAPFSQTAQNATLQYYISFAQHQDPNKILSPQQVTWPAWTTSSPQMLNFSKNAVEIIADTFRQGQYQTLKSLFGRLRL